MTKFFENRNDEVGKILTANFKISADATGVSPRMTAGAFQVSQFFFFKNVFSQIPLFLLSRGAYSTFFNLKLRPLYGEVILSLRERLQISWFKLDLASLFICSVAQKFASQSEIFWRRKPRSQSPGLSDYRG